MKKGGGRNVAHFFVQPFSHHRMIEFPRILEKLEGRYKTRYVRLLELQEEQRQFFEVIPVRHLGYEVGGTEDFSHGPDPVGPERYFGHGQ